jgi:hypothetical protein
VTFVVCPAVRVADAEADVSPVALATTAYVPVEIQPEANLPSESVVRVSEVVA